MNTFTRLGVVVFLWLANCPTASAQNWAWMGGGIEHLSGSYGTIGIETASNQPGVRASSVSFKDAAGNFWLFGGGETPMNDLWKYNTSTGRWVWMKGSNTSNPPAVYGTIGVESSGNTPGGMVDAQSWTDAGGNFWLFNGEFWRFNVSTNNWTYLGGTTQSQGNYGTLGVENPANRPGARTRAVTWCDNAGNLLLFGGVKSGLFSDLWKYNIASGIWTWIGGSNLINQYGSYGTMKVESPLNRPGARYRSVAWKDASGDLWLFGGYGYATASIGNLNDLWRFHTATGEWSWMHGADIPAQPNVYGTIGVGDPANQPSSRYGSMGWVDANTLWLHGGWGNISSSSTTMFADLWKYDISSGYWTWMKGTTGGGVYGTYRVPDPTNKPGARRDGLSWTGYDGNLWLFGGYGLYSSTWTYMNDLWRYDVGSGNWTWMSGVVNPLSAEYGSVGIPATLNRPGGRYDAASWKGQNTTLWVFGGLGYSATNSGTLADLWKYEISTDIWTWMKGPDAINTHGIYGVKGTENGANIPGGRIQAATWSNPSGNLWLFGGNGYALSTQGYLNDLWKYDPSSGAWTWVCGSDQSNQIAVYGERGTAAPGNVPGPRYGAVSWTDAGGNLWLFGGYGRSNSSNGYLNDLWKFTVSTGQWTWMNGSNLSNQSGVYGTMKIENSSNVPGARRAAVSWVDEDGNLWLYGGIGYASSSSGYLNDLWKYTTTTGKWTWMKGSMDINQFGTYGVIGTEDQANCPGARYGAVAGSDAAGNFWLFGGTGYASSSSGPLNDFWEYDVSTGNWTWRNGPNIPNQWVVYGEKGLAAPANRPYGTYGAASWTADNGEFWLFGGNTYGSYSNDLWKCKLNTAPIAICQSISVPAVSNCSALASIDNGSYDPDGDQITVTQSPAGPYPRGTTNVTLTVTDQNGAASSCSGNITVTGELPSPVITVTPAIPVDPGGQPLTIYPGFGLQSVTLIASGGSMYSWSPDPSLSCTDCASTTASPTTTTTYTVTAMNEYGCTATASITIAVVDVRCGNNMDDVIVCHRCQNAHSICIGASAVQAHLNHGDYLGECQEPSKEKTRRDIIPSGLQLGQNYPNPFTRSTTILYDIPGDDFVLLRVFDVRGRVVSELVKEQKTAGRYTVDFNSGDLPSGVYLIRLETGGRKSTSSMTIVR